MLLAEAPKATSFGWCRRKRNMFSPSAVIMKSLRSVKIEFGIFYRDLTVFPERK